MNEQSRFGIRDAFWVAVLCLVLAVWGWDRGRLSERLAMPPTAMQPPSGPGPGLRYLPASGAGVRVDYLQIPAGRVNIEQDESGSLGLDPATPSPIDR